MAPTDEPLPRQKYKEEESDLKFGLRLFRRTALPVLLGCVLIVLFVHMAGLPFVPGFGWETLTVFNLIAEVGALFLIIMIWMCIVCAMLFAGIRFADWLSED